MLSYIVNQLRQNKPAVLGSGKGFRDWIYIDDLVSLLIAGITAPVGNYDLGTGVLCSLRDVAERISELMGVPVSLLKFDPGKDRGDTAINDCAACLVPGASRLGSLDERLQDFITRSVSG